MVSVSEVLRVIMDDKSLSLFNTIALMREDNDVLTNKLGLTRKQYYSRISHLKKAHLIKTKNRSHHLTSFGIVVYKAQKLIESGVQEYWKLGIIDSIESGENTVGIPTDERKRIIDRLIDKEEVKDILLNHNPATN